MIQAAHLELRDAVGKLRHAVATGFASLFPNTSLSDVPINRLNGNIIWDTFLVRLKKHYHEYVTVEKDTDGRLIEGQAYSVFLEFTTPVSDLDEEFPRTQLSASDWEAISECFVDHLVPHGLRHIEAAHRRNEDLKLMFRLFVPLFIWAYNEYKLWLIVTDTPASPDRDHVFRLGSALDVRCHFNERKDDIYQSLTKVISQAVDRAIQTVGGVWDKDHLFREHSKLLIKFNTIRKCLNILVDDALLDLLLSHDATMSLYRRRSHKHDDDSNFQMESLAATMEKIYNDDVFSAEDETTHEKKLIEVNDCLRDVNYHGNALISTEQRIDTFVGHAFSIRVGSEDPKQCHDYTILQALLEKLRPSSSE